jgi:hypothetical protein
MKQHMALAEHPSPRVQFLAKAGTWGTLRTRAKAPGNSYWAKAKSFEFHFFALKLEGNSYWAKAGAAETRREKYT